MLHIIRSLVILFSLAFPQLALAFGGGDINTTIHPIGKDGVASCAFSPFLDVANQEAQITLVNPGSTAQSAGGNYWFDGTQTTWPSAITVAHLQSVCDFSSVTNLEQNGADGGSFVADAYIGVSFRAISIGETAAYDYEIALSGAANTLVINTRTAVVTNTPPTADAGEDFSAEIGYSVDLDGSGSSANDAGQTLTYAWTQISGPTASYVSSTTAVSPDISLPYAAAGDVLVFRLVVNDGFEDSVADTVSITLFERPDSDAGPNQTVASGALVQLDGSGSTPGAPNPSIVQYIWTQNLGTRVTLINPASATPSFVAPVVPPSGPPENIRIQLVVFDGETYSYSDIVDITVNPSTDTTNPTVGITGLPANYEPGTNFFADVIFSEPVQGFDASDISVVNGTVASVTGSGANYAVEFSPSGATDDISISIAAGVVTDVATNPNVASSLFTVAEPLDVERPTVTITDMPASYQPGVNFAVTITFSEDVFGFEPGDITAQNADVVGLTGSGANYIAEISPSATTADIEVSIAEGVAADDAGNLNEASGTVTAEANYSTRTQEVISDALVARGRSLIMAQPNLRRFLSPGAGNRLSADISRGVGDFRLATGSDSRLWAHATANWSKEDDLKSSYANLSVGAHLWSNENVILGAMVEVDDAQSDFDDAAFSGKGWLAGPYLVARIPDQPLVFSASYLVGKTENDVTLDGAPTDSFSSDRTLLTLGVEGSYTFNNELELIPSLDFYHLTDKQGVFRDSNGIEIQEQTVKMSEASFGLGFKKPIELASGVLTLSGGVEGVFYKVDAMTQNDEALYGRVNAGLDYSISNLGVLSATAYYDGIGQDGYEALGASVLFEVKF